MNDGVIRFVRPNECKVKKFVRNMDVKQFGLGQNLQLVEEEAINLGVFL
jgi:CRISPR-associated protein Cas5d